MPTSTRGGLPVVGIVIVAGLVFAPKLLDEIGSAIGGVFGANDPVIVGEGEIALKVAPDAQPKVERCTTQQIAQSRTCDDLKVVIIDAAKMAFIARNIELAWASGQPSVLHRESTNARAKRTKVCGASVFKKTYPRGSCDEFAFASSREGGPGARTEEVHEDEQNCQGGTISWAYQNLPINEGDAYLVVIRHPDKIANQAWAGQEVKVSECLS